MCAALPKNTSLQCMILRTPIPTLEACPAGETRAARTHHQLRQLPTDPEQWEERFSPLSDMYL